MKKMIKKILIWNKERLLAKKVRQYIEGYNCAAGILMRRKDAGAKRIQNGLACTKDIDTLVYFNKGIKAALVDAVSFNIIKEKEENERDA